MKARMIFGWLVVAVAAWLSGGCSTTKFTAYHGTELYQGAGGVVLPVDGIDFYVNDEPSRKYRILGMIMEEHWKRVPLGRVGKVFGGSGSGSGEKYAAVAKVARERGGNAVMVLGGGEAGSAGEEEGGRHRGGRGRKFVVVKYVD